MRISKCKEEIIMKRPMLQVTNKHDGVLYTECINQGISTREENMLPYFERRMRVKILGKYTGLKQHD